MTIEVFVNVNAMSLGKLFLVFQVTVVSPSSWTARLGR